MNTIITPISINGFLELEKDTKYIIPIQGDTNIPFFHINYELFQEDYDAWENKDFERAETFLYKAGSVALRGEYGNIIQDKFINYKAESIGIFINPYYSFFGDNSEKTPIGSQRIALFVPTIRELRLDFDKNLTSPITPVPGFRQGTISGSVISGVLSGTYSTVGINWQVALALSESDLKLQGNDSTSKPDNMGDIFYTTRQADGYLEKYFEDDFNPRYEIAKAGKAPVTGLQVFSKLRMVLYCDGWYI